MDDPFFNPMADPDSSPEGSPVHPAASPAMVQALNTAPPAAPGSARSAVATVLPATILQTVAIRSHVPVVLDLAAANYSQWRRFFDTVIGKFGLRAHIDAGAVPRHHDPEWVMVDNCVMHWLYTTISSELLDVIMQPEDTALSVWTALQELFRDNQLARAVYVDAEYHALVQGDMTIMQYCTKLKSFTDQLRNLGQPVSEVQQVFNLLRGLGRQYRHSIPHITSRVPLPTFLQARSFLLLEEHRAEQSARQTATHALLAARAPPPPPAYGNDGGSTSGGGGGRNRGRGRNKDKGKGKAPASSPPPSPASSPTPAPRPPVYPAPAPGAHSWTGVVQAWPVNWRAPGAGVLGPRPGTPHQQAYMAAPPVQPLYQQGFGGLPSGGGVPFGYGYGFPGAGPSTPSPPAFNTPGASTSAAPAQTQPWDMSALHAALQGTAPHQSPSGGTSDWYFDTGASSHMSSGAGNLHSLRPSSSSSQIVVGNGAHLPITHTGTGTIATSTTPLTLRNVLLSPSLIKNLLSVRQLCRDNPVSVEFDAFGFSVKDLRTRTVILRCNSDGDLYPVASGSSTPRPPFAGVTTVTLWHQRLGHPGHAALRSALSSFPFACSKSASHTCHACQLGKNARLPFQSSQTLSYFPFQLLHLDVWTSPVVSISGYQYYLVVLDDFSHYVWTFPCATNLMSSLSSLNFLPMSKLNSSAPFWHFKLIMGASSTMFPCDPFSLPVALSFAFLVLTRASKMGKPSVPFAHLMRVCAPFSFMPPCLQSFGQKLCRHPRTY
jgi:hypothetical protein